MIQTTNNTFTQLKASVDPMGYSVLWEMLDVWLLQLAFNLACLSEPIALELTVSYVSLVQRRAGQYGN